MDGPESGGSRRASGLRAVESILTHDSSNANTTVCVVALPTVMDPIRLVGDEDKHATLLFLGEISSLPGGAQDVLLKTIAKTSQILSPFTERIQSVNRLGSDNPPALVANLSNRALEQVRDTLLVNPEVAGYLSNTPQYPTFTPHVTLAYPDYQAEAALRTLVENVYRVRFDRLALWWGNERFEISLANDSDESVGEMSMADRVSKVLEHHGTKGMKWGVRNDAGHEGQTAKTKTIAKADLAFEKSIGAVNKGRGNPAINNAVVSRINARTRELNDSPKYRNLDIASPKIKADYDKAGHDLIMRSFEDGVREVYGSNASGTKKGVYNRETDKIDIVDKAAKHADVSLVPDFVVNITRDDKGYIATVELVELDANGKELAHHGIKGMRWGISRTKTQLDAASEDVAKANDAKAKIKANKGSTHALSNKELQTLVTRMNLEQQYSNLTSKKTSTVTRGTKEARNIINAAKTGQDLVKLVNGPFGKAFGSILRDTVSNKAKGGPNTAYAYQKTVRALASGR